MWLAVKSVFVFGISIIVGVLASLFSMSERAVAPDIAPPSVMNETPVPEPPMAEEAPAGEMFAPNTPPKTPVIPMARIDDYEKSLREALEALAQIQTQERRENAAIPDTELNSAVRSAVVNIICVAEGDTPLESISASGVIIDPRGVILTNAHVAQYFLLKDYPAPDSVQCIARTGSPAKPAYTLSLLFISPSWVAENAGKIGERMPKGDGEHDYALAMITGLAAAPDIQAPTRFPYLSVALSAPKIGDTLLLAGYPAGFLNGDTIQNNLFSVSAYATVEQRYTFGTHTPDLFSIGGSAVAQRGASGGAAARQDSALAGLITTSSNADTTAERELRALSTEYIIRDFENERGITLRDYLARDLDVEQRLFEQNTAPALSAALVTVLER